MFSSFHGCTCLDLSFFFPADFPLSYSMLLIGMSFITSGMTAAVGLGGGVTLIAIMASVMPAAALVPVHGVVQLGSNAGRALVHFRHIDWGILAWYCLGALLGAALGGSIAVNVPAPYLRLGIAAFVLWVVWGRKPKVDARHKFAMGIGGFIATLLSMFFGASGPVGAAFLSTFNMSRHGFVANQAVTTLFMHIFKIAAFGLLGFAFAPWLGLILLMTVSGFLGTLVGSQLLGKMNEATFKKGFKIVMTLLALNLLWQALSDILA
ncbi:MAG: sulfite exporter TauE/SafE family protein [Rhodobacteraceae bacterium]|nr:sulfite exporter TauE/SafE family protein [Paracoccaceae bacterium]